MTVVELVEDFPPNHGDESYCPPEEPDKIPSGSDENISRQHHWQTIPIEPIECDNSGNMSEEKRKLANFFGR